MKLICCSTVFHKYWVILQVLLIHASQWRHIPQKGEKCPTGTTLRFPDESQPSEIDEVVANSSAEQQLHCISVTRPNTIVVFVTEKQGGHLTSPFSPKQLNDELLQCSNGKIHFMVPLLTALPNMHQLPEGGCQLERYGTLEKHLVLPDHVHHKLEERHTHVQRHVVAYHGE